MSRNFSDEMILVGLSFIVVVFLLILLAIGAGVQTAIKVLEKPKQRLTCKKGTEQVISIDVVEVTLLNRKKFMQEPYTQYRIPGASNVTQVTGNCTVQSLN